MFPETFIARAFFRKVSQYENPSMRAVAKLLRARQASTRLIFASNSSKGQILRALLNSMRPFDTPKHILLFGTSVDSGASLNCK